MNMKKVIIQLVVDLAILGALGLFFLYNKLAGAPYRRGFFCDDVSIAYPRRSDTISWGITVVVGVGIPIFVIVLHEILKTKRLLMLLLPVTVELDYLLFFQILNTSSYEKNFPYSPPEPPNLHFSVGRRRHFPTHVRGNRKVPNRSPPPELFGRVPTHFSSRRGNLQLSKRHDQQFNSLATLRGDFRVHRRSLS
jgi:hypothetical protein